MKERHERERPATPEGLDPGTVVSELMGMMAEVSATGRCDEEVPLLQRLVDEVERDPSRARAALTAARRMRAGRQEDAEQGV